MPLDMNSASSFPTPIAHIFFPDNYNRYTNHTLKIKFIWLQIGKFPVIKMSSHLHSDNWNIEDYESTIFQVKISFWTIH